MGQRPKDLTPQANLHHYWGAELRMLRGVRGLSLAELGHRVHCDPSYLGKIERAERPIPATLAESCDHVLHAQGTLVRLHALAESDQDLTPKPGHQPPDHVAGDVTYVASPPGNLAGGATLPAAPDTGPGTGEEIVVAARMSDGRVVFVSVPRRVFLQGIRSAAMGAMGAVGLTATPIPTLDVHVAHPADVNPVEHFQQLRQVLIDNDNLFGPRQVIPVVREQIGIMQQLRSSWRGTDRYELVRVQAQYAQFYGWLYQDSGEYQLAECWIDRALALAHMAADLDLAAYILARKAHLAGDMRVAIDAVGAAEQALRMAPPRSRIAVVSATFAGHGYALSGDQTSMERAYDRACELLGTIDVDPGSPSTGWLDETYIALQRARSTAALGDYHCAVQRFQRAIADLPACYRRGCGLWLARAALATAGAHQVEHAATLGLQGLAIGIETSSAGILTELAQLDDALAPWNTVPAVADFRTAMKDTVLHQA